MDDRSNGPERCASINSTQLGITDIHAAEIFCEFQRGDSGNLKRRLARDALRRRWRDYLRRSTAAPRDAWIALAWRQDKIPLSTHWPAVSAAPQRCTATPADPRRIIPPQVPLAGIRAPAYTATKSCGASLWPVSTQQYARGCDRDPSGRHMDQLHTCCSRGLCGRGGGTAAR